MIAVTNYDTVNGQLIGESTGGVTTTYLADELGSVVQTAQSGAVVNRYLYSPYGRLVSKTGLGADPRFLWIGALGYRITSRNFSEEYIRARHYSPSVLSWGSRDRQWPGESAYGYAHRMPVIRVDPSGLGACSGGDGCCCQPGSLSLSVPDDSAFYNDYSPVCRGAKALKRSGNFFKVKFSTSVGPVPNAPLVKSDCKLRWCECRQEPWSATGADNQWKEWVISTACKEQFTEWTGQHNDNWDCTPSSGSLNDAPSMPMKQLETYSGSPKLFPINLFITVVIEAGKPCEGKKMLQILQSINLKTDGSKTDPKNPMFPGTVQEGFAGSPLPGPAQCQQPSPCES